jgi:hypothetical protein
MSEHFKSVLSACLCSCAMILNGLLMSDSESESCMKVNIVITGQNQENLNRVFSCYNKASREVTELLQAIKMDTHISGKCLSACLQLQLSYVTALTLGPSQVV